MQLKLVFTKTITIKIECHLRNVLDRIDVVMTRNDKAETLGLITKFARARRQIQRADTKAHGWHR